MQKLYAVYGDKIEVFLGAADGGRMRLIRNPTYGWGREKIGRWSLSKAQDVIKKRKTFKWDYTRFYLTENGNPIRMALRIIRVRSDEWYKLTGTRRPIKVKIVPGVWR